MAADPISYLDNQKGAAVLKLPGRADVTYPYGDTAYPRVVRQLTVAQADKVVDFLLTDGEYTTCKLISQLIVAQDDQYARVIHAYERLPSPYVITKPFDAEQGAVESKYRLVQYDAAHVGVTTATTKTTYAPMEGSAGLVQVETVETWPATSPSRAGQLLNRQAGLAEPYVERVEYYANDGTYASQGLANCEATPHGVRSVLVREYIGGSAFKAAILSQIVKHETTANLDLPAVLLQITVMWNANVSNGDDASTGVGVVSGSTYSETANASARSNGSASLSPEVNRPIKEYNGRGVPATYLSFFLEGSVTRAAVLARLAAADAMNAPVNAWPLFDEEQIILHTAARQASLGANASASEHRALSADGGSSSISSGQGKSVELGGTSQVITIAPTLHGAITIANPTKTVTVTAVAGAALTAASPFTSAGPGTITKTLDITATVKPAYVPATVPAGIPFSGPYLVPDYDVDPYQYVKDGSSNVIFQRVVARVVDMAYFAKAPSYVAYLDPAPTYSNGVAIEPNSPVFYGGIPTSYACNNLTPLAAMGLSFNTVTGVFTGTAGGPLGPTTYTVTATNAVGSVTITVTITVLGP